LKISQEIINRIIQLCKERKQQQKINKKISIYPFVAVTILDEFGVHLDNEKIRDISRNYREQHNLDENFELINMVDSIKSNVDENVNLNNTYKSTIELNKDGSQTSDKLIKMSENDAKDVKFLLKEHGYDIKSFELISARNNIWNSYSQKDGIQTLYSSKIVVKPVSEYVWNEEDVKKLFESIRTNYKNKINITSKQYENNDNILVVPIADFHYNLLSDKYSTGNDYNTEIAKIFYYYTLNDIVSRVSNRRFEKVLFIVGNDFVNADNLSGTTTKLTPQDNNIEWFNAVRDATQLIIDGIDILTNIAPTDVVYVPSNHDLHTMFGIMQTVKAWYRNDEFVNIKDGFISPNPRKYYKYGKTLLGLSHDIKVKDALKIFTSEAKDQWSDSTHMIWLLGHLHQEMIYDKQGYLEIMRLPTISGWSRWTNNSGYIQSDKRNQSFIINKERGITDTFNTVII
jgi:hypothetical protein